MNINSFDQHFSTLRDFSQSFPTQAFNLLEYQKLIKANCPVLSDQWCMTEAERYVPNEDKCVPLPDSCNGVTYYTSTGSCNNLQNPRYGQVGTSFLPLLPTAYADGISKFRKSVTGNDLPSPRAIGNALAALNLNKNYSDAGPIHNLLSVAFAIFTFD
ncbi:hypothetical protein HA402_013720 [Bradysia odoriphaga]|nr:hypothetical protein HA402_013720 [Bradysia odoriphaga]